MERYYGVIKDKDSAIRFATALKKASTTESGSAVKTLSEVANLQPDDPLYDYTWLGTFMAGVTAIGYVNQVASDLMKSQVLSSLTKSAIKSYDSLLDEENDVVIALGDKTFIVVHPKDDTATTDFKYVTRMRVVQKVVKTTETTIVDPETGEETTTKTTVTRANSVDLYDVNSNNLANCIAYEITKTYSGDVLVKIATCNSSTFDTETYLKPIFTQLGICNYDAWIDSNGVNINQGDGSKMQRVFGYAGSYGGFVLHQMKIKKDDASIYGEMNPNEPTYGLTIFWYDGTPMYTWSDQSGPWDELDSTETTWVNLNNRIGRKVDGTLLDPDNPKSDPVIKMGALAPIVCPSMQDTAKYAKWLFQAPHDYSYFDKSGHLYLKGIGSTSELENSNDSVFFMDYGIALWDGPLSEFNLTDKTIPDVNPENLGLYQRPVIDDPMPYSSGMWAYFDCTEGLSASGWMNYRTENDFIFTNGPVINSDGSAHFANRYSNPITGMVLNGKWAGGVFGSIGSIMYAVCKWHVSNVRGDWAAFIFGMLFDRRIKEGQSTNNVGVVTITSDTKWYESDIWVEASEVGPVSPDTWVIVVRYTRQNSDDEMIIYDMEGNQITSFALDYKYEYNEQDPTAVRNVNAAVCICGDPVGIWWQEPNLTIMQGKKQYPPWDAIFPEVDEEVTFDLKFFAAGIYDANNTLGYSQTIDWNPQNHVNDYIKAGVEYLAERFGDLNRE